MLGSTYFLQAKPVIPGKTYDSTGPIQAQFGWVNFTSCLPVNIQFVDSSITNGATIVQWFWDFGDGTTGTDPEPSHDYYANGSYPVTYTITDDSGRISTTTGTVVISTNILVVN